MGVCDLIPGISGGTIAFITGIYQRLIEAVKSFSPEVFMNIIFGRDVKNNIKKLDLGFLITLFLGIATSIFLGANLITFLMDNYFSFTIAFFVGLILASVKLIYDKIEDHKIENTSFGLVGLAIGILLAIIIPVSITPTLTYVFISGFLAISAMFLPGISGAFILLILGVYEFMLSVVKDIWGKVNFFLAFILGAILGAFTISRIISYLFKKDKNKTLYTLLGLVVGSLSIPVKRVFDQAVFNLPNMLIMVVLLGLGAFLVLVIGKYDRS